MTLGLGSPLHGFSAHRVPLIPDFSQQIVQLLSVIWQQGFFFEGSACPDGGVVDRLLPTQSLLELLGKSRENKTASESLALALRIPRFPWLW